VSITLHDITAFRWRHPFPSLAVAWNSEFDGAQRRFLLCVTWWRWSVVVASKPNPTIEAAADKTTKEVRHEQ
jgi:hypothetical protein